MASIDQLKQALINADKAGDTAAAQKLAQAIRAQQQAAPAATVTAATATTEEPSTLDKVGDFFTGNLRETEQTQTLPEWTSMPELNDIFSVGGWKTALGTLMAGSNEVAQVIKANNPNVQVTQDEKGNYLMRSPSNGKWYAIPPGLSWGDIPRAGAALAAFTPAGRAGSILGAGAASAGTQAVIEGTQAASGGEFNPADVVLSGITGAALPAVVGGVKRLIGAARGGAAAPVAQAVDDIVPPPPTTPQQPAPAQGYAPTPTQTVAAPVTPASPVAMAVPTAEQSTQFGTLAKKAADGGIGSVKAKEELARLAAINPEAKAAADALGIDLPLDVISDSRLLQETVGLSRSIAGSEQSSAWAQTITAARDKADEALAKIDASPDIATVSETVKQSLGRTQADLKKAAGAIYDQVDAAIPKPTPVNLVRTQRLLSDIVAEVGDENLSAAERRLYKMATDPKTTYGALLREKSQIGKALERADSANPYGSVETGTLKRIYGALAEDQLESVGTIAGQEARDNLRYANQLVAKRKGLEQRIVTAFGKEGEGSIATKLTAALKTGAKGDITQLNKVIKTVPQELRKEAISSALMANARTTRGLFSFGSYETMYQGLRKNGPVYAMVEKEIGKEGAELLRSLYVVSKRVNAAEQLVLKTGKANQSLLNSLTAESLVKRVMDNTAGRTVAAGARMTSGVPLVGNLAEMAANAVTKGKSETVTAAGKLLTSPDFAQLAADIAEKGAEKTASSQSVRKLAISPTFAAWANRAGLPKGITVRERWIRDAILAEQQFKEEK